MLTRWPLTQASHAYFSPSINIADEGELWCNNGDQAVGGGILRGVQPRGGGMRGRRLWMPRSSELRAVQVGLSRKKSEEMKNKSMLQDGRIK